MIVVLTVTVTTTYSITRKEDGRRATRGDAACRNLEEDQRGGRERHSVRMMGHIRGPWKVELFDLFRLQDVIGFHMLVVPGACLHAHVAHKELFQGDM